MLSSKCEVPDSKKLKFIKNQEASALLSSLGMKIPFSEVPLLGLFCFRGIDKLIQYTKLMKQ